MSTGGVGSGCSTTMGGNAGRGTFTTTTGAGGGGTAGSAGGGAGTGTGATGAAGADAETGPGVGRLRRRAAHHDLCGGRYRRRNGHRRRGDDGGWGRCRRGGHRSRGRRQRHRVRSDDHRRRLSGMEVSEGDHAQGSQCESGADHCCHQRRGDAALIVEGNEFTVVSAVVGFAERARRPCQTTGVAVDEFLRRHRGVLGRRHRRDRRAVVSSHGVFLGQGPQGQGRVLRSEPAPPAYRSQLALRECFDSAARRARMWSRPCSAIATTVALIVRGRGTADRCQPPWRGSRIAGSLGRHRRAAARP